MSAQTELQLRHVAGILAGRAFRFSNEVQLHELIEGLLTQAGLPFVREYKLDEKNRLDFWLDGLVIEVKVDGSIAEAIRQIERYVKHEAVSGIVLATACRWGGMKTIDRPKWAAKPFLLVHLRRQSL